MCYTKKTAKPDRETALSDEYRDTTLLAVEVKGPDEELDDARTQAEFYTHWSIGVGVDDPGGSVFFHEGFGKTSKAKARAAFGSHIERGSRLVHDMEGAHDAIASGLGLASERHNARLPKGVPDELNPLYPVNRMCFLLKRFLGAHPGFDRDDLQGYLNLFHVIANPPEDKMEKAAMVLDRAMQCPKTVRFRSFYNVKSR